MRQSHLPLLFLLAAAWFILNFAQSVLTELLHDEAYYWLWQHEHSLALGYFDHPPVIAFLIRIGTVLLPGEAGVRLMSVLLSTATLALMYAMLEKRQPWIFASLAFSIAIIHVGGFVAVPDTPLIFFAALFLFGLQRYLSNDSLANAGLLALSLAGMAYSKYTGVLLPVFAFMANPALFKRRTLWIAIIGAALLVAPHLLWQWTHDFPTFRYHLFDRGQRPWRWGFFWEFLGSQFLVFGPLMAPVLFWTAFRSKPINSFERSLKWVLVGTFMFFVAQSLRKPAEANWTAVMIVPLVYFTCREAMTNNRLRRLLFRLAVPSTFLLLAFRLFLVWDYSPSLTSLRNEVHGWESWAHDLSQLANGRPVIFENSYQKASKYTFYSRNPSFSINTLDYAGKQHDLWVHDEEALQGQEVLHLYPGAPDSIFLEASGWEQYEILPNLHSYNRVRINIGQSPVQGKLNTSVQVPITLTNTGKDPVLFQEDSTSLEYGLFWYGKPIDTIPIWPSFPIDSLAANQSAKFMVELPAPAKPGDHWRFRLSVKRRHIIGRNSHFTRWKLDD